MIHVFGDSWTYSYKKEAGSDDFDGQPLSAEIENILKTPIINHGERGFSNFRILDKIHDSLEKINKGDTVLVLQTDPLRSIFIPWDRHQNYLDDYILTVDSFKNLIELCDQILFDYYTKLKELQGQTETTIVLHGGCSKLNSTLAKSIGLIHTELSSSEIIAKSRNSDFNDCYFFDVAYIVKIRDYLLDNTTYYKDDAVVMMEALIQCQRKHDLWHRKVSYFAGCHPTPQGTQIVAEYLADFLQQNSLI